MSFFEVHHGTTRTVLLVGPFALKLPRLGDWSGGVRCNRTEAEISRTTSDPRLCPVLASLADGLVVIMPRADVGTLDASAIVAAGFHEMVTDPKPANTGTLSGRAVLVDYGDMTPPHKAPGLLRVAEMARRMDE